MTIDQATLASRLKQSREASALTQDEVAKVLGIARTAIVQIESANRAVSSLELDRLARLYRRDISDFFATVPQQSEEDPFVVLHRIAPGVEDDPSIKRQVDHCLHLCREGKELEKILVRPQRSGPPAYNLPNPRSTGEAVMQGSQVAAQERQRLGIGDSCISDIAELINSQGVWATSVELPDEMSGMFINHSSLGMIILVNIRHWDTRMRFSYAHEYAHALLDKDRAATISSKSNSRDLTEQRANAFGAAFLMPSRGIEKALVQLQKGQPSRIDQVVFDVATEQGIDAQVRNAAGSQNLGYQDAIMVARWFDVSYEAIIYRLKSLGHINQAECEKLLAQGDLAKKYRKMLDTIALSDDDAPKQEKKPIRELNAQIAHLAVEAHRRNKISRGRLLELSSLIGCSGQSLIEFSTAA
jgi:Zn-dependent peptidase ImmA (M78 family)/transcriptional regulator with XRE-family HTH domain